MARLRERLRMGGRDRSVVVDPVTGTELIVLHDVEEIDAVEPGVLVEATPHPASLLRALRRERREVARHLDRLTADLGGLTLEMARRERFNHPLLERRARAAADVERRLAELDASIAAAGAMRRRHLQLPAIRPLASLPPARSAVPCATCGAHPPADGNFCTYCGTPRSGR